MYIHIYINVSIGDAPFLDGSTRNSRQIIIRHPSTIQFNSIKFYSSLKWQIMD